MAPNCEEEPSGAGGGVIEVQKEIGEILFNNN